MTLIFQVICALFSGMLTALAIPNELFHTGVPALGFLALAPLYAAVKKAKTYKGAALLFALDALSAHLLSSYWLANFKDFAVFTLGASALGTACIEAMAGCLYFFPFAGQKKVLGAGNFQLGLDAARPLHFAAVRVVYEWAKSTGFLAYPWGVLSMSAAGSKVLIQSADIFGSYGISFLMAFCAACVGEFALLVKKQGICPEFSLQKAKFNLICWLKCLVLLFFAFVCYGSFRLCQKSGPQKTLNAVLVQQNMDPWASDDDSASVQRSMALSEMGANEFAKQGKKTDLVVWSEAVLRSALPNSLGRYEFVPDRESLLSFIKRIQVPFVIGGPYLMDRKNVQLANAALVFDKNGRFRGYYGKRHLVPFAEVIPGAESAWVRAAMERLVGFSNGWTPGKRLVLFDFEGRESPEAESPQFHDISMEPEKEAAAKVRTGIPICFEDAFPDVCGPLFNAGAELFLNITDDSWSKTKSAEWQHFAVAVFRAIEYRTSLVRSTNAGVTAVVDNKGRVLQSLPLFESGCLCAQIPIYQRRATVYSIFGDWFAKSLAALLFVLALLKAKEARPQKLRDLVRAELEKINF